MLQLWPVLRCRVNCLGPIALVHQDLERPLQIHIDQLVKLSILLEMILVTLLDVRLEAGLQFTSDLRNCAKE